MDRNRFNKEVRPHLIEIPIGKQGIGFDRLDLDAWVDNYKTCNGRPAKAKGVTSWDAERYLASSSEPGRGTSTSGSSGRDFARALEQLNLRRPNESWQGKLKRRVKPTSTGEAGSDF
jgi:hypothetical protein